MLDHVKLVTGKTPAACTVERVTTPVEVHLNRLKEGNFEMNNKDLMYILPTPPQLILIILDFMDSPSVGPQAACIHQV